MVEKNLLQARTATRLGLRLRTDRRKVMRHTITLPVKVAGIDCSKRHWSELAETVNVSSGGVAIRLARTVMIGDILHLEIALPERFQIDIEPSATYISNARVRYIEMHERQQIVRLEFHRAPKPIRSKTLRVSARF